MKTRLSLICIAITMFLSVGSVNAQHFGRFGNGNGIGGQQSAFQAVRGDLLRPGLPGRLWFEASFADEGLGYNGSYLTLGGKTRLFQDSLDGRWLIEGNAHQSIEDNGGFFSNLGIERVFSIKPANADISIGVFWDHDSDDQQFFSEGFNQIGLSGAIRTPYFDVVGNGYFPVGTDAYTLGDPSGAQNFVRNNIALQAGIESALEGFDVTLRTRPKQLAFANGYVDFGGYHYDSDLVDSFAGGRLRVGIQLINSLSLAAEVNQDERFDTTGALSVSWTFGNRSSGYGSEYAGLARDLEKFARNDHIVRFSQDLIVAVNPLTGQPFNVVHANNTQLGIGDGSFESPFATLAEAEAASQINGIIFVNVGDGTDLGYQNGVTLQAGQQLLSGGGIQFVQEAGGTLATVTQGGTAATISNVGGNEVVRLADNNIIGGINIDATGSNFGVFGANVSGGTFNGTSVSGASIDGVGIENVRGDWTFTGNTFANNMRDGVFINGAVGSDAVFTFNNNIVDTNVFDGIHLANYEAGTIILNGNQTDSQGRHGVFLENALDPNGDGTNIFITDHMADLNGGNGVFIDSGAGSILVTGGTFSNSSAAGLAIRNWRTDMEGDAIVFADTDTGVAPLFTGNVMGLLLRVENGLTSTVNIDTGTFDGNTQGIVAEADGVGTVLNLNVGGTATANNNAQEAIVSSVDNGATLNSVIEGTAAAPLAFNGNSAEGGAALNFLLDGGDPNNRSTINTVIRNVNVNSVGGSALAIDGFGESVINLLAEDSLLLSSGTAVAIDLDNNINGEINQTYFDNVDIRGNFGVVGNSQAGTLWDLSITNSLVRSDNLISDNSPAFIPGPGDFAQTFGPEFFLPFTDATGTNGIFITANDGITLVTNGDAQMLAILRANQILRNGPGLNDDGATDDGVPGIPTAVSPDEGFFHDGLEVVANGSSTISLEIINNNFLNNFNRSFNLTTNGTATINAFADGNRFTGDIGVDENPPSAVSIDFIIGEIGLSNFGGNIRLDLASNRFNSVPVVIDAGSPNIFLGLDSLTNDVFPADVLGAPFTVSAFGLSEMLIEDEETGFGAAGFSLLDH